MSLRQRAKTCQELTFERQIFGAMNTNAEGPLSLQFFAPDLPEPVRESKNKQELHQKSRLLRLMACFSPSPDLCSGLLIQGLAK